MKLRLGHKRQSALAFRASYEHAVWIPTTTTAVHGLTSPFTDLPFGMFSVAHFSDDFNRQNSRKERAKKRMQKDRRYPAIIQVSPV